MKTTLLEALSQCWDNNKAVMEISQLTRNNFIIKNRVGFSVDSIFSRLASLARQAFLITPLHGARYKTGKTLTPKSSAM